MGGGGGGDQKKARALQERQLALQRESFEFSKAQALKLEEGKESEEAKAAAEKQRIIELKRRGRSSTIKTISKRQSFERFTAEFEKINPLDIGEAPKAEDFFKATEPTDPIARVTKTGIQEQVSALESELGPLTQGEPNLANRKRASQIEAEIKSIKSGERERIQAEREGRAEFKTATAQFAKLKGEAIAKRQTATKAAFAATPGVTRKLAGKAATILKRRLIAGASNA